MIPLKEAEYLWDVDPAQEAFACGGLLALGDANGDGSTDIVVALHRKNAGPSAEQDWIETYSGKDGSLLWQVQGKYDRQNPEGGYHIKQIALVGDLDDDGVRDIYCQEAYSKRSALLFSGRNGQRLGRYPIERHSVFSQPIRCQDLNGDGVTDLVFPGRREPPLGMEVLSGKDLSPIFRRDDLWPEAKGFFTGWIFGEFEDVNRDGVSDCLVCRRLSKDSREARYLYELAVLSGKDFSILKRFQTEWPRVHAQTTYAKTGDLNGDGIGDFVMASRAGAGPQGQNSLLRAFSGANGAHLWQVAGDQLPGGRTRFAVDAKTHKRTPLSSDVLFGSPVVSTPDLDGDGVGEVVTTALAKVEGKSRQSVLIFSGRDGRFLAAIQPDSGQGVLTPHRTQIALLESNNEDRQSGVAVSGQTPEGQAIVHIFVLPRFRGK